MVPVGMTINGLFLLTWRLLPRRVRLKLSVGVVACKVPSPISFSVLLLVLTVVVLDCLLELPWP